MSDLITLINEKFSKSKLSQKELVAKFLEAFSKMDTEEELKDSTLSSKLSKLLKGTEEGIEFFFKTEHRTKALSKSLGVTEKKLRKLHDNYRDNPLLILDPELGSEVVDYFEKRAADSGGFSCLAIPADELQGGSKREVFKDKAKEVLNSIVVLADENDEAKSFYKGADVITTTVERHPLGYLLKGFPDLVKFPDRKKPKLFDENGEPLVPVPEVTEGIIDILHRVNYKPEDDIKDFLRDKQLNLSAYQIEKLIGDLRKGTDLSYGLEQFVSFNSNSWDCFLISDSKPRDTYGSYSYSDQEEKKSTDLPIKEYISKVKSAKSKLTRYNQTEEDNEYLVLSKPRTEVLFGDDPAFNNLTFMWHHNKTTFIYGSLSQKIAASLTQYHTVSVEPSKELVAIEEMLQPPFDLNPRGENLIGTFEDYISKVAKRCDVDIDKDYIQNLLITNYENADKGAYDSYTYSFDNNKEKSREAKSLIREVLKQEITLQEGEKIIWILKAILRSPIHILGNSINDYIRFEANLGAGHFQKVKIRKFPKEVAKPVEYNDYTLDGGHLTISLDGYSSASSLEGFFPLATKRRREETERRLEEERQEEERRRWEDDYYYDDDD